MRRKYVVAAHEARGRIYRHENSISPYLEIFFFLFDFFDFSFVVCGSGFVRFVQVVRRWSWGRRGGAPGDIYISPHPPGARSSAEELRALARFTMPSLIFRGGSLPPPPTVSALLCSCDLDRPCCRDFYPTVRVQERKVSRCLSNAYTKCFPMMLSLADDKTQEGFVCNIFSVCASGRVTGWVYVS